MDPRTIPDMKVSRIRAKLAGMDEIPEPILKALKRDRRASVRKLAERPVHRSGTNTVDMLVHERKLWVDGIEHVAGVDEAGRGPLAGPVVAAAVILPHECDLPGLTDSKKLTAEQREELEPLVMEQALSYTVAHVDVETIDRMNILQATFRAMREALAGLSITPDHALIDGNHTPGGPVPQSAIVKGDATSLCIAAASVLAKVSRDRYMVEMDETYPGYGFAQHKGYGTPHHKDALKRLGPCPLHRRSFFGVIESDRESSPGYAHMSRAIRAAGSEEELEAVGAAIAAQVNTITGEELISLRKHYRRKLAQFRRRRS